MSVAWSCAASGAATVKPSATKGAERLTTFVLVSASILLLKNAIVCP